MNYSTVKNEMESNTINSEIGENALKQIIIPASLKEKFIFSINAETGDLDIEKKTEVKAGYTKSKSE